MKISGFSYIRNGFTFDYPFLESIQSVLPVCDEFVIAVGDSNDGTRQAIAELNSNKIKIIDTVWEPGLRKGGKILAQQANIALDNITGDWGFHIQADEVLHEKDLSKVRDLLQKHDGDKQVDGFLFSFLNFYGSCNYIGATRRWHRNEVRIIRNTPSVRSFRDAMGFRKYSSKDAYNNGEKGQKLNVIRSGMDIFHYSYVRPPEKMRQKQNYFHSFWHDDKWLEKNLALSDTFDYSDVDYLEKFKATHPAVMKEKISKMDSTFCFDPAKAKFSVKGRLLYYIEKFTGWRVGEYRNYRVVG